MRNLTLALVALSVGCASKTATPALKAEAGSPTAAAAEKKVQNTVPASGETLTDPHVLKIGARELDCLETVTVVDKGDYVQATGCDRLIFWVKQGPKEWVRAGPAFQMEAPDRPLVADSKDPSFVAAVQTAGSNLELTADQWAGLSQWQPEVRADCVARVNGTLGYCYVSATEPTLLASLEKAIPKFHFQPAKIGGKPVSTLVVVALKVEAPNADCGRMSSPLAKAQCEGKGAASAPPTTTTAQ